MPREYRRAIARGMPSRARPTFDALGRFTGGELRLAPDEAFLGGSADSRTLASAPDTEREFRDRA